MMALLDTWALAFSRWCNFCRPGSPAAHCSAPARRLALTAASEPSAGAEDLARRLIAAGEFAQYQQVVASYTHEHPLGDLQFVRALGRASCGVRKSGTDIRLVADSVGTIAEGDGGGFRSHYSRARRSPCRTIWKTELALREAGYRDDIRAALSQLDERLPNYPQ